MFEHEKQVVVTDIFYAIVITRQHAMHAEYNIILLILFVCLTNAGTTNKCTWRNTFLTI